MVRERVRGLWLAACLVWPGAVLPASAVGEAPGWVDEQVCRDCHADQATRWQASQHARAMQPATAATVLGDFSGRSTAADEPAIRFTRRAGRYSVVATDGAGRARSFEVTHTFGVAPLQQYLVRAAEGRLQALTVAWDTVGKRWFSLYPGEALAPTDPRHWTRRGANWNTMCAACHSGGVRKGYDLATDRYDTRYQTVAVGCQACHGPAAGHLARVAGVPAPAAAAEGGGDTGFAPLASGQGHGERQVDACAQCHAFRTQLVAQHRHDERFLDQYLPVLLSEGNYFADGQQQGEVFVWGSWLQSRMHQRGLVCSDCHEVHSGALHAAGDALCTSCHGPQGPVAARVRAGIDFSGLTRKDYRAESHHRHGSTPPACVACHAGKRDYMVVDGRLDHAFRIPRPEVAARAGAPDPCTACHTGRDATWAVQAYARLYRPQAELPAHYGDAFSAARAHGEEAAPRLLAVARDTAQPAIVRANALQLLGGFPGREAARVLRQGTADASALVRLGAVHGLGGLAPAEAVALLVERLDDPVRSIRVAAVGLLLGRSQGLDAAAARALERALGEYEAAQRENADRPEGLINLARLALHRGRSDEAEHLLRLAATRHRGFVPAHLALAEILRRRGGEAAAAAVLDDALRAVPGEPALREAQAQALVRQRRYAEAEALLAELAKAGTASATGVLLHAQLIAERGDLAAAGGALDGARARLGGRRELLLSLAALQVRQGQGEAARATLDALARINPDDPALPRRP